MQNNNSQGYSNISLSSINNSHSSNYFKTYETAFFGEQRENIQNSFYGATSTSIIEVLRQNPNTDASQENHHDRQQNNEGRVQNKNRQVSHHVPVFDRNSNILHQKQGNTYQGISKSTQTNKKPNKNIFEQTKNQETQTYIQNGNVQNNILYQNKNYTNTTKENCSINLALNSQNIELVNNQYYYDQNNESNNTLMKKQGVGIESSDSGSEYQYQRGKSQQEGTVSKIISTIKNFCSHANNIIESPSSSQTQSQESNLCCDILPCSHNNNSNKKKKIFDPIENYKTFEDFMKEITRTSSHSSISSQPKNKKPKEQPLNGTQMAQGISLYKDKQAVQKQQVTKKIISNIQNGSGIQPTYFAQSAIPINSQKQQVIKKTVSNIQSGSVIQPVTNNTYFTQSNIPIRSQKQQVTKKTIPNMQNGSGIPFAQKQTIHQGAIIYTQYPQQVSVNKIIRQTIRYTSNIINQNVQYTPVNRTPAYVPYNHFR